MPVETWLFLALVLCGVDFEHGRSYALDRMSEYHEDQGWSRVTSEYKDMQELPDPNAILKFPYPPSFREIGFVAGAQTPAKHQISRGQTKGVSLRVTRVRPES